MLFSIFKLIFEKQQSCSLHIKKLKKVHKFKNLYGKIINLFIFLFSWEKFNFLVLAVENKLRIIHRTHIIQPTTQMKYMKISLKEHDAKDSQKIEIVW